MVQYDKEIARKESELARTISEMDAMVARFRALAVPFVADWYMATARHHVESRPEISEKIDDGTMANLKRDVQALGDSAGQIVEEFLGAREIWWHKLTPEERGAAERDRRYISYAHSGHAAPNALDKPMRLALGRLATVLQRYGYIATDRRQRIGLWLEWDESGNHHPPTARACYPGMVNWPKDMQDATNEYAAALEVAKRLSAEIETLKRDKAKAIARKRWDSV